MRTAARTALILLSPLAPAALADVHYVWPDAPGVETGLSWYNAHRELYSALSAASPGDEIWVSEGTFKPFPVPGWMTFDLKSNVRMFGGMPIGSTSVEEQDVEAHATILSGDRGVLGDLSDNSPNVLRAVNVSGAVVDGFMITQGNATYSSGSGYWVLGGGVYLEDANVRFYDCSFQENYARNGGAIAALGDSSFRAENCVFYRNTASTGGGGGIFVSATEQSEAEGFLERCRFQRNAAVWGGAVQVLGHLESHSCLFADNSASSDGGGIDVQPTFGGSLVLVNATMAYNEAVLGFGGALNAHPGDIQVLNSILCFNNAGSTVSSPQVQVHPDSAFRMEHTDLQDLSSTPALFWNWGDLTRENLSANPRFRDVDGADGVAGTLDDDFRLRRSSPCADAGDRTFYPTGYPLFMNKDLAGVRRIARSFLGFPMPPVEIDMGAHELQPARREL